MRRQKTTWLVIITLLILLCSAFSGPASAQEIDLSNLTYDELVALKDRINGAIWNNQNWEEVTVPQGVWQIGADIPAGHWTIKAADGVYSYIQYGSALDEAGDEVSYKAKDYISKNIYSPNYEYFNANEDRTEVDIDMKDGAYFVINSGSVVFSPYSGKQSLGFKGMKATAPSAETTPIIEYVYITPEPTAIPTPTPIPTANPTPVIEYVYITPEPTAVPTPTPVPTSTPTPVIEYIYITPEPTAVPVVELSDMTVSSISAPDASMTYDDLVNLHAEIGNQIKELERQYAIKNGNRVISLDHESITLFPKQTQALIPEVKRVVDDAPETTSFVWSSSDETVATVSAKGLITAVAAGDATITCTASDDEYIFASIPVSVVARVSSIALSDSALTLHLSDSNPSAASHLLGLTIEPSNAYHQTVTWSSSNEEIAAVDAEGYILALKPGTATITATSTEPVAKEQQPKKASVKLTVVQDVNSIELSETALRIKKAATATLKASVFPENATNKKVTWESSDPAVATITAAGQISAKACGSALITCKAVDGSEVFSVCDVTVFQPVTAIKPEKTSVSAFIDSAPTKVSVAVSPEDATDKTLVWSSSDPAIATVDESGYVTAISGGSCKIICTTNDGTNKSAELSVLVPSISVEKTNYTVTEKSGLTIPLKYFGQNLDNLKATLANRTFFTADLKTYKDDNGITQPYLNITPEKAGKTIITLNDSNNEKNAVKLNVEISSSAVYDSVSYPKASYDKVLRYPEDHENNTYQIYGRVLQTGSSGSDIWLRVGTRGYNDVFFVTYSKYNVDARVIEDDYVTIYGECTGTYTYKSTGSGYITIPSLEAEKIKIGRK